MINYFDAAGKTLRSRGMLETALRNLEKRKDRILRHAAPSEYPSADMSKPYTSTRAVNDTLAECVELAETMREIRATEEKIEEIRIVNRAKWLLISQISMDEPGAHRYIEKQAMDRCISKREIAEEIIKTYS